MVVSKPWHIILNLIEACLLVHKIEVLSLFPEQLSGCCYGRAWNFQGEPQESSAILEMRGMFGIRAHCSAFLLCAPRKMGIGMCQAGTEPQVFHSGYLSLFSCVASQDKDLKNQRGNVIHLPPWAENVLEYSTCCNARFFLYFFLFFEYFLKWKLSFSEQGVGFLGVFFTVGFN